MVHGKGRNAIRGYSGNLRSFRVGVLKVVETWVGTKNQKPRMDIRERKKPRKTNK
jgi:hypothetical protein